jgi:mRNA-degrading endonuclease toxin of MazEF toxin-antitoxin module
MNIFNQGDIVWVNYPFSDQPKKRKVRPAIIISNAKSNEEDNDYLICPITTKSRKSDFSYIIEDSDVNTSLPERSEIRCNKLFTLREHLIIEKLSEINENSLKQIIALVIKSIQQ